MITIRLLETKIELQRGLRKIKTAFENFKT